MRVRIQKRDIRSIPSYHKDTGSVFIFDDNDKVVFAIIQEANGVYRFTHVGEPDFDKAIKQLLNIDVKSELAENITAKVTDPTDHVRSL